VLDGQYVVSSCLAGEVRVWDCSTGDCKTTIDRSMYDLVVSYTAECNLP